MLFGLPAGAEPPAVAATPVNAAAAEAPAATPSDEMPLQVMCVRSCDGFYFPIRQNGRRETLPADAMKCSNACGGRASIFYFPTGSGGPDTMIDLAGRRYRDLPNAFLFRSRRFPACSCRPPPWSKDAVVRHRGYAATVEAERERQRRLEQERALAAGRNESAELSAAASKAYYGN